MRTDFCLVEASWRALETFERLADREMRYSVAPPVLIRWRTGEKTLYYVEEHGFVLDRVGRATEQVEDGPEVREVLALRPREALTMVDEDTPIENPNLRRVVVNELGPVGVIMGRRRVLRGSGRPGHPVLEGGDRNLAREPPGPLFSASLPSRITAGATASLRVSVPTHPDAPTIGGGKIMVTVQVEPSEGLSLVGRSEAELDLDALAQDGLSFTLTGGTVGTGKVCVRALRDGIGIATLRMTTSIVAGDFPEAPPVEERAHIDAEPRRQPDLAIRIEEKDGKLTFFLTSAANPLDKTTFWGTSLEGDAQKYFRVMYGNIERLPLKTAQDREEAQVQLEQKGASLFEAVFPEELRVLLWRLRDRIATMRIASDEPWIPWELCRLFGTEGDAVLEDGFFAEKFCITRWLHGVMPPSIISLDKIALIVPEDSNLAQAAEEKKYIRSLASEARQVIEVPPTFNGVVTEMRRSECFAWHFTGHARADDGGDANQAAIELNERKRFKADQVVGNTTNFLANRPFIFLNACQSAQGGISLTSHGGWAQRFIRPNAAHKTASAFIGAYWAVDDKVAFAFAKALYSALLDGVPIGAAVRGARLAVRKREDPTWLAYTVYADPFATVKRAVPADGP